eukprot:CAMPEP_0198263220 /NCGR_PEP_ID=MMETSP1447-20131203/11606_1 /TAXON_ID=420782 /ORGANISM="Chaetoceros dichaeta, Strain CCMP1751" /LENGTH=535 /DNA_ID=CAMNT_0043951737 /DNA_START=231 /DNA_END=1835 /DNA_ORIENTATION=-
MTFLTWRGTACQIFNVGKYRREAQADMMQQMPTPSMDNDGDNSDEEKDTTNTTDENENEDEDGNNSDDNDKTSKRKTVGACDANFFDHNNPMAREIRSRAAKMAMEDMITWLRGDASKDNKPPRRASSGMMAHINKNKVAIFDATNSTAARRKWVLEELNSPAMEEGMKTGVIFVESVCDDAEMLEENFRFKVQNSPDFEGMTIDEAIDDLRKRVEKYEEQYETIQDDTQSYIKIFNLSSKLLVNHVYGKMAKVVVPSLMSWNIGSRPIYLCRAGETGTAVINSESGSEGGSISQMMSPRRGGMLGSSGLRFRDALAQFLEREGFDFAAKRESALKEAFTPSVVSTGTSVSGIAPGASSLAVGKTLPFRIHVMSSTMPRAVETATWPSLPCEVDELPNLNPLDKGDFSGMEIEEIKEKDPQWYELLEEDPFITRFPGGECYKDLIHRLETCIIDMEQQVNMVCVVSHISVLQVLIAYFRRTPIEKCASIRVPMHTVIKFTPVTGGSWSESQHALDPELPAENLAAESDEEPGPIW